MKKSAVLLCVLILIVCSYEVATAAPPDKDVIVTNTSANPVPVAVGDVVSVMNIDERARVPYYYNLSQQMSCPSSNQCVATFPAVPAGKRLRLTNVRAYFRDTNVAAMFKVNKNRNPYVLLAFPLTPFNGFYDGAILSLSQSVDLIFEAGESPMLELGVSASDTIHGGPGNLLGVTGYLVDVP